MRTTKYLRVFTSAAALLLATAASAASSGLTVAIDGLDQGGRMPDWAAFCPSDTKEAHNISPKVSWSAGPAGTRSYALVMTDPDVPKDFSTINKPGVVIAAGAPRISVFHWVLTDIPATMTAIERGAESEGLIAHGKPIGKTAHGQRGANIFTSFLATNKDMAGTYGGYDGPCPPMNDARAHHYTVKVFALDIPSLGLTGAFDGEATERAMKGHILASGEAIGIYTLNPQISKK